MYLQLFDLLVDMGCRLVARWLVEMTSLEMLFGSLVRMDCIYRLVVEVDKLDMWLDKKPVDWLSPLVGKSGLLVNMGCILAGWCQMRAARQLRLVVPEFGSFPHDVGVGRFRTLSFHLKVTG